MVDMMPTEAEPAWNAYLAMDKSKQAHFNLLERLEKKYSHTHIIDNLKPFYGKTPNNFITLK